MKIESTETNKKTLKIVLSKKEVIEILKKAIPELLEFEDVSVSDSKSEYDLNDLSLYAVKEVKIK